MFGTAACAMGLFAAAWAQQPVPVNGTNYYPGKVSPPPANLLPTTKVTPPAGTATQPATWHMSPAGSTATPPGQVVARKVEPTPTPTPTLTPAPTIVPAGGPVGSATQPIMLVQGPTDLPPTTLPTPVVSPPVMTAAPTIPPPIPAATIPTPTTPAATLPPPTITLETTPAPTIVAEPKPLSLGGTSPIAPPALSTGPVPTGLLQPRHTTGVVVETVSPESVSVGQDCAYELVVRNEGPTAVWNVRVDDELPAGTKYLSSEPAGDFANGRLSWGLGTVEAGGTKRIKVMFRPSDEGELRNRTVVTFAAATESKMKVTRPKVAVQVAGPESAKAGEEVAFTIKLTNSGSGPATNLVMQARLSDGLHNPNGAVLELKLPSLPAGQTKTIPLKAVATKAGAQVCSITSVADGTTSEPAKSNVTIVEPKLTAKVVGPAKCLVKAEPVYTLEFTNPGTAGTDPLTVAAAIPAGFEYVQASDGGLLQSTGKEVVWKLTGLPAGQGKAVSLKLKCVAPSEAAAVRVMASTATNDAAATGTIQSVAAIGRGLEAKADLAIRAEGIAALRFEVVDVEDPVEVGKEAIYEIKVTNQGTGPCTNILIVGVPAEGTTPVTANGPTTVRVQAGQMIFDPIAKLDVKGEAVYRVRVKGTVSGDQKFRVQVSCDQIRTPISKEENTRFIKD
jgi:uncharacterized repeat protein (TIGR01451 family)